MRGRKGFDEEMLRSTTDVQVMCPMPGDDAGLRGAWIMYLPTSAREECD